MALENLSNLSIPKDRLLDCSCILKYNTDETFSLLYINDEFMSSLGYTEESISDITELLEIFYPDTKDSFINDLQTRLKSSNNLLFDGEYQLEHLDNTHHWYRIISLILRESNGTKYIIIDAYQVKESLSELSKLAKQFQYEAEHDNLTSLYNRKLFHETLGKYTDSNIALIIIDIDYFKDINDTYGHQVGDHILKNLASILIHNFRDTDYICRIGGDEFAIIMMDILPNQSNVIETKLNNVMSSLKSRRRNNTTHIDLPEITISAGIAFRKVNENIDIYKNADIALYKVKYNNRNSYSFYNIRGY